jgi:hypothetical protein
MGKINSPRPVKLFVGVLTSLRHTLADVETRLESAFGPLDAHSEDFDFDLTHYYDEEMGRPIVRRFLAFRDLISPERISEIKILTNEMEFAFVEECSQVRRPVNLDPGYLEEAKIVLASTKNFYHRILLRDGIYGEVTLHYAAGAWQPFPWSFPDFRTGRYDAFFTRVRNNYREQLKVGRNEAAGATGGT